MATWIHDLDTLRSLADDHGLVAHWARLQRLARGVPTPLPCSVDTALPMLSLLPDGLDAWVAEAPAELLWILADSLAIGATPHSPGAWTGTLERHLEGPYGRYAANILVGIGEFTRAHLRTVLEHDRDDYLLLGWVLASTPADQLDAVAIQVAAELRGDIEHGCPRILRALYMLTPGHPSAGLDDPYEAVEFGAMLADSPCRFSRPTGSLRGRTNQLIEAVTEGLNTPAAALGRALARLRKAPVLDPAILAALSWESHFKPADPWTNVVDRSARSPADVYAARMAVRGGAQVALPADEYTLTALLIERSTEHPEEVTRLLYTPGEMPEQAIARMGLILRNPDRVPGALLRPETRGYGIFMARFTPTVEVLEILLGLSIPAEQEERYHLAMALVNSGDPAALPNLSAILGHLDPEGASEVRELARSIFNQEL